MKFNWRYIKSFFSEEIVERSDSNLNPGLQVWYAYGKYILNSKHVNYSFGKLDMVFRSAFSQMQIEKLKIDSVLLLGLGAGNVPRLLKDLQKNAKITAIEFDPEVLRLARKYFELDNLENLNVVLGDAFSYIENCTVTFDLIIVDLFVDEEVPAKASDPEFLKRLEAFLNPKGHLMMNRLGHTSRLNQQTEDFGRKITAVLHGTIQLQADTNTVFVYEKK